MSGPRPDAWEEAVTGACLARASGGDPDAARRFATSMPAGYRERVPPHDAAADLAELLALSWTRASTATPASSALPASSGHLPEVRMALRPDPVAGPAALRLRRYASAGVELSGFLPTLESFGLVVVEAVPTLVPPGVVCDSAIHLDDFGLRRGDGVGFDAATDAPRLLDAMAAVAAGVGEVDSLNRLVLAAGLTWPQVRLLRAYRRFRRQAGSPLEDAALDGPLVAYPAVAAGLVGLFEARFDPAGGPRGPGTERSGVVEEHREVLGTALAEVSGLADDQVLGGYLALVDATLRTSYFLRRADGRPLPTVALKLDSGVIDELPRPRPVVETFVHGPAVEGVHLRFGLVARGGLRWSDRPDDFRTEVLGLAEAQVKKNAIIVPTGAKGGFVCRPAGAPGPEEVLAAYQMFVSALLDVTDNIRSGRVVTPEGVVARDGDDPYLVVAADRGTATFSDVANALADERHFWLGDAFASGGSRGYDHKAMGITARGAWAAVRSHFHQLGIDVSIETIRVVGVGDMSGDVFGNGMLQSRALALVAAFDHRHVFLDPDPDPVRSFAERERLAARPSSSWADYDPAALSAGGGVWSREVKSIPLSLPVRRALGVDAESLAPPQLVSAILAAPVDLVWFGGIGTYVRSPDESDIDVGDHANDGLRVTSEDVRARVVAEGGNLAVTQMARIRYSRRGGRINADFIDNAAGVATSDREVNLKILAEIAIGHGRLAAPDRDGLLAEVGGEVAAGVLAQVSRSVAALTRAVPDSAEVLDAYEALLADLTERGRLDPAVEGLPRPEELARRRAAGAGWIRPELAVLMAYAKLDLCAAIESSSLVGDPALLVAVEAYFPPAFLERASGLLGEHRLYPQLVATNLAGEVVERMGVVWAHETAAELAVGPAEVVSAYWVARQVLGVTTIFEQAEKVGATLSADADAAMHRSLAGSVARLARRYLLAGHDGPSELLASELDAAGACLGALPPLDAGAGAHEGGGAGPGIAGFEDDLLRLGVPGDLSASIAAARFLAEVADARRAGSAVGRSPAEALEGLVALDRLTGIDHLRRCLERRPVPGRWASWQRRALLDDLADWRRDTVGAALGSLPVAPVEAVEAWVERHRGELGAMSGLITRLEGRTGPPGQGASGAGGRRWEGAFSADGGLGSAASGGSAATGRNLGGESDDAEAAALASVVVRRLVRLV